MWRIFTYTRVHWLILILFIARGTVAQNPMFTFENINTKDGLSSLKVQSITQDNKGFIWIGTMDGLNRYDGYQFKVYRHNNEDSTSIPVSRINKIHVVNDSLLWLATKNEGLIKFNPITEKFIHFTHSPHNPESLPFDDILELYMDKDSVLWCTYDFTTGFYITEDDQFIKSPMPKEYREVIKFRHKLKRLIDQKFNLNIKMKRMNLQKTYNGDYWIGILAGGCYYYFSQTNKIIEVTEGVFKEKTSTPTVFQDRTKVAWLGKFNDGILKYNSLKRNFNNYIELTNDNYSVKNLYVRDLLLDKQKKIWIAAEKKGLIEFDPKTNIFRHYLNNPNDPKSLPFNKVRHVYIDRDNRMWVGTVGFLSEYDRENKNFINYPVRAETGNWKDARIYQIAEDDKGIFWIANWDNIIRFNKKDHSFRYFSKSLFGMDNIRHILLDDKGLLWISAEYGGIAVFDPKTEKTVKTYNKANGLSNNGVFQVYQESENIFWAATFNGLNKIDIAKNKIKTYTMRNGLSNNIVMAIIKDKNQNYWLPTANGLVLFNPQKEDFYSFFESDGLQHNEFVEGAHFVDTASQSILVGGIKGFNWFHPDSIEIDKNPPAVAITSLKILNNEVEPRKLFNNRIILNKPIEYTNEITLYYSDRVFTFEFSALHYNKQGRNQYAYKMEGFDKGFVYTDASRRYATYTNLDPGKYTFKVIASNNYGVWNKEGATIKVTIIPPFWQTDLFRFIAISSTIIILLSLYRIRINIIKKRNKILETKVEERTIELQSMNKELEEKKKEIETQKEEIEAHKNNLEGLVIERTSELEIAKEKAEESDRLKTSFLENMSHEIRTPMNAIIGFSSLLDEDNLAPESKSKYIELVHSNGQSLLALIDEIIDLSKIQSGVTNIKKTNFQLNKLLDELYQSFDKNIEFQNNTNISFTYQAPQEQISICSDHIRCKQIITNLLSNAFKYTAEGTIELGCRIVDNSAVHIFVKDTGIGISEKDQGRIFDRFSKIEDDTTKLYGGVGLGLSISKPLALLLGGDITVESELGKGSEFTFTIPYSAQNKEHSIDTPKEKEKLSNSSLLWKNKNILIVEDEDDNYFYLYSLLENTNVNLLRAVNGLEAVDFCSNNEDINLVLMDIKLPKMNGFDAMKQIKTFRKKLPIIAQTAYAMHDDIEKMRKAKFDDILTKPISKAKLFEKLSTYLKY